MDKILSNAYTKAKAAGRLCERCKWIVTVKDAAKGHKTCANCRDALKGVNVRGGHGRYFDEPRDGTGETI